MNLLSSGYVYLLAYIILVGVATFMMKFSMKELNPFQVSFLMALGMLATAVPALSIKQGNLKVPVKGLPPGAPIGLLMALGSICYTLAVSKVPVGTASAIVSSYVIFVALLSWLFLGEKLNWMKIIGILLTVIGVALLSWEESK